ncbi:MAG: hypothetical protein ACWGSD_15950 [Thermodesulfobacteriota bacterium]
MKTLVSASLALLLVCAGTGIAAADPEEPGQAIQNSTGGTDARMEQRMERWTYRTQNRFEREGEGLKDGLGQGEGSSDARMERNTYRTKNRYQWRGERTNDSMGGRSQARSQSRGRR